MKQIDEGLQALASPRYFALIEAIPRITMFIEIMGSQEFFNENHWNTTEIYSSNGREWHKISWVSLKDEQVGLISDYWNNN